MSSGVGDSPAVFREKGWQGVFDDRKQVHGSSASAPANSVIWINWNRFDNLLGCLWIYLNWTKLLQLIDVSNLLAPATRRLLISTSLLSRFVYSSTRAPGWEGRWSVKWLTRDPNRFLPFHVWTGRKICHFGKYTLQTKMTGWLRK